MSRIQKDQTGFSIIELLITLVVLTLAFGSFVTLFVTIKNTNARSKNLVTANAEAFQKLQEYENSTFDAIPIGVSGSNYEVEDFTSDLPANLPSPVEAKVFVQDISANLLLVRVHVEYNSGARQRDVDYTTYIQRSGIGR